MGAGYRASDDDSTVLTRLGDTAQVRVADVPLPPCRRVQPAVFFRARGHAPEWLLEIRQGELTLLAGQGLASRSWFLDAVGGDAQRRVYSGRPGRRPRARCGAPRGLRGPAQRPALALCGGGGVPRATAGRLRRPGHLPRATPRGAAPWRRTMMVRPQSAAPPGC